MSRIETRLTRSDRVRFRLQKQLFKDPVLVLQVEMVAEKRTYDSFYARWSTWSVADRPWKDATLEDLSVMHIQSLNIQRDGGEMPACFRPLKRGFGSDNHILVLQVLNGAIQNTNSWRDARMQDLLFKDGNFLGGVGLVSR